MEKTIDALKFDIKNWWLHLLSGILLILAGMIIFLNPLASYMFISIFFSVSLFVSGIIEIIFALTNSKQLQGRGWHLAAGIIDLLVGSILILYPLLSLAIIPFILGFWLMFRGVALITFALYLKNLHDHQWGWLLIGGIFLSLFSFFIIINPTLGAATAIALVCSGFWITGISNVLFSLRLKQGKIEKIIEFT